MSAGGRGQRCRQRGHGQSDLVLWLVVAMPFIVGGIVVGVVALTGWIFWRLCK